VGFIFGVLRAGAYRSVADAQGSAHQNSFWRRNISQRDHRAIVICNECTTLARLEAQLA